jgi:predicted nuclease of predicted toxin-antitoxin system
MKLLANENIPGVAVTALVADGHDVAWVRTTAPGMADAEVLAWAARESRILLTFDKDFGELARTATLPSSCGVILFRLPAPSPGEIGPRIAAMVAARPDWAGHFSVIEPGRVRMRPLQSP